LEALKAAELAAEYHKCKYHIPSNPEENLLVETLVASEWRLRRMRRVGAKRRRLRHERQLRRAAVSGFGVAEACFER
jgi:hypothetical protein